ncbi:MAG: WbqC family protein [Bacteroidia bacterium]|nr:WbqC family protein [Bacteroidia bacterium]
MRRVSIHQPNYIPWLGYFYKIAQSDVFVFLDDVQFSNEGMHNWHYIKTTQGSLRLKIPVQQSLGDLINEVRTKDELNWKAKHLKAIEANYFNTKFFDTIYPFLSELLLRDYPNIAVLNSSIIVSICKSLRINTEFVFSSNLVITSKREKKVLDIVEALKGDVYYSGTGAKAYQLEENFTQRGIELRYSTFTPFEYTQQYGNFQPNISIIDFLMNCGFDWNQVFKQQNR